MEQKFFIFEYRFNNEELEKEFNDFFHRNNLHSLFTNEHMAGTITVSFNDARSVINNGGAWNKPLLEFAEILTIANDNKSYEEVMFRIIYESRSMQGMIGKIKKIIEYIKQIDDNKKHNTWNIVWYNKDLK